MLNEEQGGHVCASCGGACAGNCWKQKISKGFLLLAVTGALFLSALFASELKIFYFIGKNSPGELLTISVNGTGEVVTSPDIASISFAVSREAKTPVEARKKVTEEIALLEKFLQENGVEKKDIQTTGYNLYPRNYSNQSNDSSCLDYGCPPPPVEKKVFLGYEVTQFIDVKIRTIDNAMIILEGLIDKGVTDVSGPSYEVSSEDAIKVEAHTKAIADAKEKAETLTKELGVSIVRISSFYETEAYPTYDQSSDQYASFEDMNYSDVQSGNFTLGENTYTSTVTIVYEVR